MLAESVLPDRRDRLRQGRLDGLRTLPVKIPFLP
jgi:hypothetical protein